MGVIGFLQIIMNINEYITKANKIIKELQEIANRENSLSRNRIIPPSIQQFSTLFYQLFEYVDILNNYGHIYFNDYNLLNDIKRNFKNPLSIRLSDKEIFAKKEVNDNIKEDLCQEISDELNSVLIEIKRHLNI